MCVGGSLSTERILRQKTGPRHKSFDLWHWQGLWNLLRKTVAVENAVTRRRLMVADAYCHFLRLIANCLDIFINEAA